MPVVERCPSAGEPATTGVPVTVRPKVHHPSAGYVVR